MEEARILPQNLLETIHMNQFNMKAEVEGALQAEASEEAREAATEARIDQAKNLILKLMIVNNT